MAEVTGELIKSIYHLYNRDDQVLVWNPLDYDFEFRVEGSPYIVRVGDKAEMPGYMANMFIHGVVDELMQKDKKLVHLNNKEERQKYVEKIVVDFRAALAPVTAAQSTEPRVLSYEKKGELAGVTFAGDHELPLQRSEAAQLSADALERLHPVDDGKGNRLKAEDEVEFPSLATPSPFLELTRAELMKEVAAKGIKVEATDTKEILLGKLAA